MNIMELGAIGELVGGVAVVASLIFVGIQLGITTRTLRSTSTYEALKSFNELNDTIISNPALAELTIARERGEDIEINETLHAQYCVLLRSTFLHLSAQQYLHQRGILDDKLWGRYVAFARNLASTPAGATWWEMDQQVMPYPPEFVQVVNGEA